MIEDEEPSFSLVVLTRTRHRACIHYIRTYVNSMNLGYGRDGRDVIIISTGYAELQGQQVPSKMVTRTRTYVHTDRQTCMCRYRGGVWPVIVDDGWRGSFDQLRSNYVKPKPSLVTSMNQSTNHVYFVSVMRVSPWIGNSTRQGLSRSAAACWMRI